jgi:amino acid adenylation domain-containing protein
LANYLGSRGIGKEDLVGICAERSAEMVVAILGSLKAGAAYVPIDPADPVQRMEGKVEDAQLKLMLTQEGLLSRIGGLEQEIICLDKNWDEIERYSGANPDNEIDGDELAYVIYTSGSTGRPKGVPISHRNLVGSTQARLAYYNAPISNYLLLPSFAFDSSVAGIFWTLCVGATLTLPSENYHQDLEGLISLISRDYVSHTLSVPSLYSHLLDALGERGFGSLRCVIVAGEASPPALADRHREMLPGAVLFNEYGPTEGTVWSTVYDCSEHPPMTQIPIGRPIPGMQSYILDSRLEPTPVGVSGEIYIGGDGVARGYVRRQELTAERFVPNRYGKRVGERLYRTGDVGRYLSDGNIEYLGRADDQVKVRGYRIELGEIQAALEEHGSVKQSVVVAREDERGRKRLLGYVVGEEGTTAAELKIHLRERLPEYMVPEAILMLEEMPLTMNGKIDRRRLPIVEGMGWRVEQEYVAPRTPVEETLVGIFEEVLKLDRVGIHDNFFEIGGHSLLVTQVISRVRSTFEVAIDVNSIFEAETVAKLAEMLIAREPKPGQMEKIAMILTKLSNMTDEDVEAELAALERQVANEGIDGDTNERF